MLTSSRSGALADGRTLRLSIQEKPKPKPQGMALKGSQTRQANIRGGAAAKQKNGPIPTGPRSQQQRQPATQPVAEPIVMQIEQPAQPIVQRCALPGGSVRFR